MSFGFTARGRFPLSEFDDDTEAAIAASRRQFREIDIIGTDPDANDPFNINTGVFDTAGAQTVFASFGTLIMPVSGAAFRDDSRIQILRNGVYQSKGASGVDNRDVYFVSTSPPKVAFEVKLKTGKDIIQIFSTSSYV